jgi:hypothetical protein
MESKFGGVNYSGRLPHDTAEVIDDVAATNATLANGKVTPQLVARDPYLQVGMLVSQLDPAGALFGHDKVEGVATTVTIHGS